MMVGVFIDLLGNVLFCLMKIVIISERVIDVLDDIGVFLDMDVIICFLCEMIFEGCKWE